MCVRLVQYIRFFLINSIALICYRFIWILFFLFIYTTTKYMSSQIMLYKSSFLPLQMAMNCAFHFVFSNPLSRFGIGNIDAMASVYPTFSINFLSLSISLLLSIHIMTLESIVIMLCQVFSGSYKTILHTQIHGNGT